MKKWLAIVGFCVFLIACSYEETINYDSGDKYVGEVSNGVRHGQGTYFYADGSKYAGEYKDDLMHGQGTAFYTNGDEYVGEWKDNLRHGQAIYLHAIGVKYVGEYKDGIRWTGITYNADGTVHGSHIEGVWQAEEAGCVKGREYTEDGKNMIDCEFSDGERYVGGYEKGLWNGQGAYAYANGDKYVGEWKDADYHGHGTYFHGSGEKYVGEWKENLKHGQGTYTWANGSKYVGAYKDNDEWTGITYNADGTVKGTFSNGKWIPK